MLLQIRDYIQREKIVSTEQLAREFKLDVTALQPMLELWMRKGVITLCKEESSCQHRCFKCRIPPVYYQYLGYRVRLYKK